MALRSWEDLGIPASWAVLLASRWGEDWAWSSVEMMEWTRVCDSAQLTGDEKDSMRVDSWVDSSADR